jgi:hypothetical protein
MRYGVIDSLFLGNILFSQIGAVIMNTGLVHYFSCMNVDGIIGMNMIRLCNWKIDYNNDKFVFQSVDSSFQQANAQKIPFQIMRGVPKVAWYVNGKKYSFTIDTGKNGIEIGVPELPQSAVIFRKTIGYNSFGLHGISQNDTTRSFLCDISDSLGFSLKNIAFEQSPSTQTLIGTGFFKKYFSSISLDFKSKYLLAEPINSVSKQITVYAFTPMQKEKHLLVGSVEVSESKISVGDTILQINEVSIEKVGICAALTNYMQHLKSEKTIDLTYLHKGEVVKSRFECSLLFGASKNE